MKKTILWIFLLLIIPSSVLATDSITIAEPLDYRIYQRDLSTHTFNITIAGTYSGSPTSIQGQIIKASDSSVVVDWTTIVASPAGGTYSGTIAKVPQGGWYYWKTRFSNSTGVNATTVNHTGVGLIFLLLGQSNAVFWNNELDYAHSGNDYTSNSLLKKWKEKTTQIITINAGDGLWHSPVTNGMTCFGNAIIAGNPGVPIGIVDYSVGGSAIKDWSSYTQHMKTAVDAVNTYLDGKIEGVIWIQGETDRLAGMSQDDYYTALSGVFSTLRIYLNQTNFFISIQELATDTWEGSLPDANQAPIRLAQEQWVARDSYSYYVTSVDLPLRDGLHLSTSSYCKVAKRHAQAYLYSQSLAIYYQDPTITGFIPVDATHTDVAISHRGGTSLTPSSGITGFEIFDGGVSKIIHTVTVTAPDYIQLYHDSVTGSRTVRYQYGVKPTITMPVYDNTALGLPLKQSDSIAQLPWYRYWFR